jgi:hypothetical protein
LAGGEILDILRTKTALADVPALELLVASDVRSVTAESFRMDSVLYFARFWCAFGRTLGSA